MTGETNFLFSAFEYSVAPYPTPSEGIGSPARGTLMLFGSGFSLFTHQQNDFSNFTSFTETAVVPSGNKEREHLHFLSIDEGFFSSFVLRCCETERCKKSQLSLCSDI